jgi:MFS family permease
VILVPAMFGAAISAGLLGRFGTKAKKSTLLLVGLVSCGITLFALANVPLAMRHIPAMREHTAWSGALFSFLLGLEFGTLMIPSVTYLMEHTADQVRGRVFALLFMVVNGATALPVLVAAGLADTVGTDNVIAGSGVVLVVTGVGAWLVARKVFDQQELQ